MGEYENCIEVMQPVFMLDEAILTCSTTSSSAGSNCSEQHYIRLSVEGKCLFLGLLQLFLVSTPYEAGVIRYSDTQLLQLEISNLVQKQWNK